MIFNIVENGWLDVITLFSPSFSTDGHFGSLPLALTNIPEDLLELGLIDHWSLGCFGVHWVSMNYSFCKFNALFNEFVIDSFMDEASGG